MRACSCAAASAQSGRVCLLVRSAMLRRRADARARAHARAVAALLVFFMTSEMTEKFLTIAPTNTLRKMNAKPSAGQSAGERTCGRERSHDEKANKHTGTPTVGRAGPSRTARGAVSVPIASVRAAPSGAFVLQRADHSG